MQIIIFIYKCIEVWCDVCYGNTYLFIHNKNNLLAFNLSNLLSSGLSMNSDGTLMVYVLLVYMLLLVMVMWCWWEYIYMLLASQCPSHIHHKLSIKLIFISFVPNNKKQHVVVACNVLGPKDFQNHHSNLITYDSDFKSTLNYNV